MSTSYTSPSPLLPSALSADQTQLFSFPSSDQRAPSPTFSRPPSDAPPSPESRYPLVRRFAPSTPTTSQRYGLLQILGRSSSPSSSPSTLHRGINTALPLSPPTQSPRSTPPSSFPARFDVELTPLTLRRRTESPFDDRHSILSEDIPEETDEDPFEFHQAGTPYLQQTMAGYQFASRSPPGRNAKGEVMTFGARLDEVRPVSHARRSLYTSISPIPASTLDQHLDLIPSAPLRSIPPKRSAVTPIRPTFRGLFALSRPRDYLLHLFPAVIVSIAASLIQPYMSIIIGNAFAVFTAYPLNTRTATGEDMAVFIRGIRSTTIELSVAGGLSVLLNYLKGALWLQHGESLVSRLEKQSTKLCRTRGWTGSILVWE